MRARSADISSVAVVPTARGPAAGWVADARPGRRAGAAAAVSLLAATAFGAVPMFDLWFDVLDPQACAGSGCWTNHLVLADVDLDGDLDIVLANYADFFNGSNSPQPLVVYRNDGTGFVNISATAVGGFTGNLRQIAVGDVNGDGAPDIYGPDATGGAHVLWMNANDGTGTFTNEADTRLPASYPAGAAARMGDVDNDGDLDIFAADSYALDGPPFGRLFLNDGTGVFVEAAGAIPTEIAGYDICDVEFFDADRDFDLDLIVNAHAGGTGALWLNDGSGVFSAGGSLDPPGAGSAYHYNITPCDVDGDGDLDLWIDNTGGSYHEQLLINDGAGHFDDQTATRVSGNVGSDDNGVLCADVDNDGDLDAVVLALSTAERLFVNDGAGSFAFLAGAFPPPTDCTLWGDFGDLDGDGRLDLVTGQGECSSQDEVYLGNAGQPVDSRPPVIIAVRAPAVVATARGAVVRFAVSDRVVTETGPRLARAWVVVDPLGAGTEVEARFMGGDLFRAQLPPAAAGTVSFQACAQDEVGNSACSPVGTYESDDDIFSDGFDDGGTSHWSYASP